MPEPDKQRIRNNTDVKKAKAGTKTLVYGTPGLYLYADYPNTMHPHGLKRWMFRYKKGRPRPTEIGIGHLPHVDLAKARAQVQFHRYHMSRGLDPQQAKQISQGQRVTFAEAGQKYIDIHSPNKGDRWLRNAKLMIVTYAEKLLREAVGTITTKQIEEAIAPVFARTWRQGREAIGFWEDIFNLSRSKGWRTWENPARWEGLHEHNFPRPPLEVKHHPAPHYSDMKAFMSELRSHQANGVGAVLLEFVILTAVRPNVEARLMRWEEIDWANKIWNIPAQRMKARRPHRVPLSDRAIALLLHQKERATGPYVFPGRLPSRAVAEGNMIKLLRNTMHIPKEVADVHGLGRTPIRDWCAEKNEFDVAAVEMVLAHAFGSQTMRAYFRSDLLEKRRVIMDAWAKYLELG